MRYCVVCQKATTFQYNKTTGHSECTRCGGRFAKHPKNIDFEEQYQIILSQKEEEIKELRKELAEEKEKNKELRKTVGIHAKKIQELKQW